MYYKVILIYNLSRYLLSNNLIEYRRESKPTQQFNHIILIMNQQLSQYLKYTYTHYTDCLTSLYTS